MSFVLLGILNSQAEAAGGAGAYDLLETTIVANSTTQTVTFSNLDTYSSYKHLQIRMAVQSNRASGDDPMVIRLNGDTGSNYTWHWMYGDGGGAISVDGYSSRTYARLEKVATSYYSSNDWTPAVIDLLDFGSTSKNKTFKMFQGSPSQNSGARLVMLASSVWMSTSAATSLSLGFSLSGAYFTAGSRLSLYGVK